MKIIIEPKKTSSRTEAGWFVTAYFCDIELQVYAKDWKALPGILKALQDKIRTELFKEAA